jgi:hypothetical protein
MGMPDGTLSIMARGVTKDDPADPVLLPAVKPPPQGDLFYWAIESRSAGTMPRSASGAEWPRWRRYLYRYGREVFDIAAWASLIAILLWAVGTF